MSMIHLEIKRTTDGKTRIACGMRRGIMGGRVASHWVTEEEASKRNDIECSRCKAIFANRQTRKTN